MPGGPNPTADAPHCVVCTYGFAEATGLCAPCRAKAHEGGARFTEALAAKYREERLKALDAFNAQWPPLLPPPA